MKIHNLMLSGCPIKNNLKKITLILFLFIQFTSSGQTKINTALWEVSGKNLTKPSYLFDTCHVYGNSIVDSSKAILERLNLSELIVGEVLIETKNAATDSTSNALQEKDEKKSKGLKEVLSKKNYKYCIEALKSQYQMKDETVRRLASHAPLHLFITLTIIDNEKISNIIENETQIDQYIQQYASEKGKMVRGLATAEAHKKILNKHFESKNSGKALLIYLRTPVEERKKAAKLLEDYGNMNFDYSFDKDIPRKDKHLLRKRNRDWMKILPGLMEKQSTFVAVGLGHLEYKQGLIMKLRDLGYTVIPVNMD